MSSFVALFAPNKWDTADVCHIIAAYEKRLMDEYWPKGIWLGTGAILGAAEI